jgi:hypothetical protein
VSDRIPDPQDHPAWWSRDAIRWTACRPERWARRRWSPVALVPVVVLLVMAPHTGYALVAAAGAVFYGWTAARHRGAACRRQRLLAANAAGGGPGLRVLIRQDTDAGTRTWVYAADDSTGSRPLFSCRARRIPGSDAALREAVMLGAPCEGARVVLVPAGHQACAAGPVRPVPWQAGRELNP